MLIYKYCEMNGRQIGVFFKFLPVNKSCVRECLAVVFCFIGKLFRLDELLLFANNFFLKEHITL